MNSFDLEALRLFTAQDRQKLEALPTPCEAFFRSPDGWHCGVADFNDTPPDWKTIFVDPPPYGKTFPLSADYQDGNTEEHFQTEFNRPSRVGDIIYYTSTGAGQRGFAYRANDVWFNLDDDFGGTKWHTINPFLTVTDRKLLDYLHEQFDFQIP